MFVVAEVKMKYILIVLCSLFLFGCTSTELASLGVLHCHNSQDQYVYKIILTNNFIFNNGSPRVYDLALDDKCTIEDFHIYTRVEVDPSTR